MKVYYAHFMGIYNTPQENRDIQTLKRLGLKVLNPNNKAMSEKFERQKNFYMEMDYDDAYVMAFTSTFLSAIDECHVFAFRALPDGRIPGGVAMELRHAQETDKIIIELPCGTNARSLGRDATREYLRDLGQR